LKTEIRKKKSKFLWLRDRKFAPTSNVVLIYGLFRKMYTDFCVVWLTAIRVAMEYLSPKNVTNAAPRPHSHRRNCGTGSGPKFPGDLYTPSTCTVRTADVRPVSLSEKCVVPLSTIIYYNELQQQQQVPD